MFAGCQSIENTASDKTDTSIAESAVASENSTVSDSIGIVTVGKSKMEKSESDSREEYDAYIDENGDEYLFKKDSDVCIGYSNAKSTNIANGKDKPLDECIEIAENFLKDKIDLSEYTLVDKQMTDHGTDTNSCYITYSKTIQGYQTMDIIFVIVKGDGTVHSISAPNCGVFNDLTVPNIDKEKINEKIKAEITSVCGENNDCELNSEMLTYEDGKFYIEFLAYYTDDQGFRNSINQKIPIE